MSQLAEVRSRWGLHYEYEYGLPPNTNITFNWPKPFYSGCCVRAFFYHPRSTVAKVRVEYSSGWYVEVRLEQENAVNIYYSDREENNRTERKIYSGADTGIHKSMGVLMDGDSLAGVFNDRVQRLHDMRDIAGREWKVEIQTGLLFLMSFHIYDHLRKDFPIDGLKQSYDLSPPFVMYVGSTVTVQASFQGGPNDTITVNFRQTQGHEVNARFTQVGMRTNDEFTLIIENSFKGWLVSASFRGNDQSPIVVARRSNEQYTAPYLSINCYIKRILAVGGPIPTRYRS